MIKHCMCVYCFKNSLFIGLPEKPRFLYLFILLYTLNVLYLYTDLNEKRYKSCHWVCTIFIMYHLGICKLLNMQPWGVNQVQRCIFWKGYAVVLFNVLKCTL